MLNVRFQDRLMGRAMAELGRMRPFGSALARTAGSGVFLPVRGGPGFAETRHFLQGRGCRTTDARKRGTLWLNRANSRAPHATRKIRVRKNSLGFRVTKD